MNPLILDQNRSKKESIKYCSYTGNYEEIYEPVYDQSIIFYDEDEDLFDAYLNDDSSFYYEA